MKARHPQPAPGTAISDTPPGCRDCRCITCPENYAGCPKQPACYAGADNCQQKEAAKSCPMRWPDFPR